MKLTILAAVILALGIALGLTLRGTATEAANSPKWATPQFVADSIQAFNQAVVQPIAATVAQLQGDVSDLDQRVTALESGGGAVSVVTDRGLLQRLGRFYDWDLVDTDDGSIIATYFGVYGVASNCDNTQALLVGPAYRQVSLIDTSDGHVLGIYEAPAHITDLMGVTTAFSCSRLDWVNSGLRVVTNRAVVSWADQSTNATAASLLDTDTGQVIASYDGGVIDENNFNCVGDRLRVTSVGIVDTATGAVIIPFDGVFGEGSFLC